MTLKRHKIKEVQQKKDTYCRRFNCKKYRGVETQQENEKSVPGATTKGMKHRVKGCLEESTSDSVIMHVGTNNVKNNESIEDIANDIMDVAISIRNEKNNVFVSGLLSEMID